jgi:hypothetical protein
MATEQQRARLNEALFEVVKEMVDLGVPPGDILAETIGCIRESAKQHSESILYYLDKVRGQI